MENSGTINDAQLREYRSGVGRYMQSATPRIVAEMTVLLSTSVDMLGHDPKLIEMLQASIDGNVSTLCHVFLNDIGVDAMQPNTGAVEYAVRLAQRDVPVSALNRAYYLGQALLVREVIDAADSLEFENPSDKMLVVRSVVDVVHRYIDWILNYVAEAHEAEQRRWWASRAMTNAAVVLKVLRQEPVSAESFEKETGYDFDNHNLAMIAWLEYDSDDPNEQRRVDQLVRKVATTLRSTRSPLLSAADRSTAWAWVSLPSGELNEGVRARITRLAEEKESQGIRLSLGAVGEGVEGFRRSHQQALRARLVALGTNHYRRARTVAFTDANVALLSLIMNDLNGAVSWTKEVLGPLADSSESNESLRQTLASFYSSGENYTRTAEALGLHRNTVRQRVGRFESQRNSKQVDALEMVLALRLFALFGTNDQGR